MTKILMSLKHAETFQSDGENDATPEVVKNDDEPVTCEETPVRTTRNPADTASEERARHDATHLPFRPWCPVCVEARATEDPHCRRTVEE